MPEDKIKIKKSEIDELYEIEDDTKHIPEEEKAIVEKNDDFSIESRITYMDEKLEQEFEEDG